MYEKYAVCIMHRCQTEMKYENKKIRIMNKNVAKVKMTVRQSFWCIFRFLCIWLDGFVLFCQEKMQRRASAIFFFKFLDGWTLFAIFATEKDAAEIKLRERGSLYQSAARLSLEGTASGCSSSRLLPQSLYVCESLWKIASLLSKNMEAKLQNKMTHLDIVHAVPQPLILTT